MDDADEDDLGAIAWPGFVDILSSVIIMFVFFLMIVAGALYIYTLIYVSQVRSSEVTERTETEEELTFEQQQSEFGESEQQNLNYDQDKKVITVFFGDDSITMLPESIEEIAEILKDFDSEIYTVKISAPLPEKARDLLRKKIAIARMLNLRNTVLSAGFAPESAIPKLTESKAINDTLDWAQIRIIKK